MWKKRIGSTKLPSSLHKNMMAHTSTYRNNNDDGDDDDDVYIFS